MSGRATPITDSRKAKVSKNQFAEVLYYWLSLHLNKKAVKKRAKEIHFKIKNNRDFNKIFAELLVFDMWLIIYTCDWRKAPKRGPGGAHRRGVKSA